MEIEREMKHASASSKKAQAELKVTIDQKQRELEELQKEYLSSQAEALSTNKRLQDEIDKLIQDKGGLINQISSLKQEISVSSADREHQAKKPTKISRHFKTLYA